MRKIVNIFRNEQFILGILALTLNLTLIFNLHLMETNIYFKSDENPNPLPSLRSASINDYDYYKEIAILSSQVSGSGSHSNFPVLISLIDTDLQDQCQADGDDIAFYSGTSLLDYEIEYFKLDYTSTEAKLVAWVRIPSLSTSTNTIIRMYYGNPSLVSSEVDPTDVWNSNYKGVWHLSENPTSTIYDSTIYNNDGTSSGTMNSADQVTGKVDGCLDFDGNNDIVNVGNGSSLRITNDITIEFWIRGNSWANWPGIITKGGYTESYCVDVCSCCGKVSFYVNGGDVVLCTQALSLSTWYHVACTRQGNVRSIYINGNLRGSEDNSVNAFSTTGSVVFSLDGYMFDGNLDEIKISNNARSQNWIITEYRNHNNPNSFYTVGSAILNGGTTLPTSPPSDNLTFSLILIIVIGAFVTTGVIGSIKYASKNKYKSKTKNSKSSPYYLKNYVKKYGREPAPPPRSPEDIDICISSDDLFINQSNFSSELNDSDLIEMKKIRIICPICKTHKSISIPRVVVEIPGKLTTIDVPKQIVCEHQFQLYVDNNFSIRGYQKVDYQIGTDLKNDTRKWKDILNLHNG